MTGARPLHLILPAGYDDPQRASGGNVYDQQLVTGSADQGREVVVHAVAGAWPAPEAGIGDAVDRELARVPDGDVVIVDGLLGMAASDELIRHAPRLRLVMLVHMPGPPGGPPGDVLRAARLVVTTSEWTARTLIAAHGLAVDTVVVAAPGAELAEPAIGTHRGGALLCVAGVTRAKGHDVLIEALAGLGARAWTCTCIGALDREPSFVVELRKALVDGGIADRVELLGPLAGADLERAYAGADLFVLPTRSESYGLVVVEALARGLPVIATSVGGVPEALGQAPDGRRPGLLVAAEDALALREAIAGWLDRPDLRAELRAAALGRRSTVRGWADTVTMVTTAVNRLDGR